jgi:S1-C subfamily serine protease
MNEDLDYLIKEIKRQIVVIKSFHFSSEEEIVNSGFIVSKDTVLTADHCVIGKTIVKKGNKIYLVNEIAVKLCSAQVVALKLEKPVFHQPQIKIASNIKIGEKVFYINLAFGNIEESFHFGYLSAIVKHEDLTYYYIEGSFCPGMSGSPIYNLKGELIGMIMYTLTVETMTNGIIVPVYYFKSLLYPI